MLRGTLQKKSVIELHGTFGLRVKADSRHPMYQSIDEFIMIIREALRKSDKCITPWSSSLNYVQHQRFDRSKSDGYIRDTLNQIRVIHEKKMKGDWVLVEFRDPTDNPEFAVIDSRDLEFDVQKDNKANNYNTAKANAKAKPTPVVNKVHKTDRSSDWYYLLPSDKLGSLGDSDVLGPKGMIYRPMDGRTNNFLVQEMLKDPNGPVGFDEDYVFDLEHVNGDGTRTRINPDDGTRTRIRTFDTQHIKPFWYFYADNGIGYGTRWEKMKNYQTVDGKHLINELDNALHRGTTNFMLHFGEVSYEYNLNGPKMTQTRWVIGQRQTVREIRQIMTSL
jgi:hypothetical protein